MSGSTDVIHTNRIALVTGGSSGIGREIAIELAKAGFSVVLNFSKSTDSANSVKDEILAMGGDAHLFLADITREAEVERLFAFMETEFTHIDVLINNAGLYIPDDIENQGIDSWNKTLGLNLTAKMLCTKYAVPLLRKSMAPRIINIASRAAKRPLRETAAYCCAATGIVMLTQVSALELAKYNIHVNSVSPGLTRTPMTEAVDTEEDFLDYTRKNPSKRMGEPKDIAKTVLFLISSDADFINGENLNVSGGSLLL